MLFVPELEVVGGDFIPVLDDHDGQAFVERVEGGAFHDDDAAEDEGFPGAVAVESAAVGADDEGVASLFPPEAAAATEFFREVDVGMMGKFAMQVLAVFPRAVVDGFVEMEIGVDAEQPFAVGPGSRDGFPELGFLECRWCRPFVPFVRVGEAVEIETDRQRMELRMMAGGVEILGEPAEQPGILQKLVRPIEVGGDAPVLIAGDEGEACADDWQHFIEELGERGGPHPDQIAILHLQEGRRIEWDHRVSSDLVLDEAGPSVVVAEQGQPTTPEESGG